MPSTYEHPPNWSETWVKAVAKAWQDEAFKQELLADPRLALKRHFDFDVPATMPLTVKEAGVQITEPETMILPARPTDLTSGLIEVRSNAMALCC